MMVWGQAPDPFAAWLLERGLKTLDIRVARQNENAMRIAEWCATNSAIGKVHYSGLPDHPDHEAAKSMMDGFGGMMAIELAGGADAATRFLQRIRIFRHAPSLGGVDSRGLRAAIHVARAPVVGRNAPAPGFPTASCA